jgi:hypothetical protein
MGIARGDSRDLRKGLDCIFKNGPFGFGSGEIFA